MIFIIVKMPTTMPTTTWMTWLLTMMVLVMTTIVLMMTINNTFEMKKVLVETKKSIFI